MARRKAKSSPTLTPYTPTSLRKTVILEQRNGVPIIMGTLDPSIHQLRDFISVQHPLFGTIHASLITVKHRTIWYRQVMKEGTANGQGGIETFSPKQK
jgi:hypothetical protein